MRWRRDIRRWKAALLASLRRLPDPEKADVLAEAMVPFLGKPGFFEIWQEHGFHVTPVHFYQPIPDTRELVPGSGTGSRRSSGST